MNQRAGGGFALVITLALLALLVVCVLALSSLVRVNGQISSVSAHQVQARQNALLGLNIGLGDLQRHAGVDARVTGMAGIAGVPGGSGNSDRTTRYWCGVWRDDGTFLAWLTSGATGSSTAIPANAIELIGAATVGAAASTSANVEKQHVVAGRIPIVVTEVPGAPNTQTTVGNYAYLVTDEGGKVSAYSPPAQLAVAHAAPAISDTMLANQLKLKTALGANQAGIPGVVSYEQLAEISPALTPSVLQDTFHYVTLTARSVDGNQYRTGTININSASTELWRCILDTYNTVPGVTLMAPAKVASNGNAIGNGFAASTLAPGKSANGPFLSVAAFENSPLLSTNLSNTPATPAITPALFMGAIRNMLRVRSDTFRIRAYGDAIDPTDPTRLASTACCEAIVQRTTGLAPNGLGNRFVVVYFRWLGPADL